MSSIKYLHLSDLHIGNIFQKGLLSQSKKILFEDIDFVFSKVKTLDVVFFTGDLVQKGTSEEFIQLEEFLKELWELFKKHDQNPYLLCVPGNHDLERINDHNNPTQKVMANWVNEDLKNDYFWGKPNLYHDFIVERFKNYENWYKTTSIRKPDNISWGYLPGDFFCSISLNNKKLGVVGLNSSFLQLFEGEAKQKIGIYNKQINHLFDEKYHEWLKAQDVSLLLTHHSPEWFESDSITEFNQEIYTIDSYAEHLCGHMHDPSSTTTSVNGFPSKRLFISPSLFGLEYFGDRSKEERIHGYSAGIYKIDSGKITKTIWPRISIKTKAGVLKISQNEDFNLDKDSSSFTEVIKMPQSKSSNNNLTKTIDIIEEKGENIFAAKTIHDKGLVRTLYKEVYSHKNIRFQERNIVNTKLHKQKYCWIVTKFGLGEDEFIGSILNDASINPGNCFCINCDETSSVENLIESFNKTFSLDITKFFDIINTLDRPLLVFNSVNEDLSKNAGDLIEFIQTIFDFSSNLRILLVSEIKPDNRIFDYVELFPLDTPAVRQYIEFSQELNSSFTFLECEKIHRLSSGIPLYIDKVIEQLRFRPISDLGDMEFDVPYNDGAENQISEQLKNEINKIMSDETKQGNRRFTLLTVVSLLHNGETFERIRRYDPTIPFHSEDISFLLKNKLIETVHVNSIFEDEQEDSEVIKIIRVPRIIRDYVSSLLRDEEKVEIYKQACNLYLGNNWRISIKLIRTKDAELSIIIHQNLQIAIRFILSSGIEKENSIEISRMTQVSLSLIEYFSNRGAYKDTVSLTEEVLLLIKDLDFEESDVTKTHLTKRLGQSLRMTSIHEKSIKILKSICDDENNSLSKKDRNEIRLSIAYAYETLDNKEEAVKYANLIKKQEKNKNSELYLAAEYVITNFISENSMKLKKLISIRNKASRLGFTTLKANVILNICRISNDQNHIKQLDKIISESKDSTYNKVRALAAKAEIILNTKNINEITSEDLFGLSISYSYSFYQRLHKLLNRCHALAWQYWSAQGRFDQLLNLFRYSSFVWRLCGEIKQEQKYIDELHSNIEFIEWFKLNRQGINSIYYEQRIFTLYNTGRSNNVLELDSNIKK